MGANSIDITQYRSRIGIFAGKKITCRIRKSPLVNKMKTDTIMESFIILSYLLVLSNVTQKLLIISGLELNPGPEESDFKDPRPTYKLTRGEKGFISI